MSEMIDTVARAMDAVALEQASKVTSPAAAHEFTRVMARAAIEAMREPICAAIHCGCSNYCDFR